MVRFGWGPYHLLSVDITKCSPGLNNIVCNTPITTELFLEPKYFCFLRLPGLPWFTKKIVEWISLSFFLNSRLAWSAQIIVLFSICFFHWRHCLRQACFVHWGSYLPLSCEPFGGSRWAFVFPQFLCLGPGELHLWWFNANIEAAFQKQLLRRVSGSLCRSKCIQYSRSISASPMLSHTPHLILSLIWTQMFLLEPNLPLCTGESHHSLVLQWGWPTYRHQECKWGGGRFLKHVQGGGFDMTWRTYFNWWTA